MLLSLKFSLNERPWRLLSGIFAVLLLASLLWGDYLRRALRRRSAELAALSAAREKAEQATLEKSQFLAVMSHEIRTPVSAIIGLLELEVRNHAALRVDHPLSVAWESAQSLQQLLGDILDLAKIEAGKMELAAEWVSVEGLLSPVLRSFSGLAAQKKLSLSGELAETFYEEVELDAPRFRQLMCNLISNAIKFTDSGAVTVRISFTPQQSGLATLILVVSDTGRGMDAQQQAGLFQPWQQRESGKKQRGSGLGLAICHQLIALMGGEISLRSQPAVGTVVTVQLPVAWRQGQCPEVSYPVLPAVVVSPLKVLAVDDHRANRLLLKHQLISCGHQVTEAENGEQALACWRRANFDLIITDCCMPGMDGLALTQAVRQQQQTPIKIIGLTAYAQPEERVRCLAAGMDDCLFKPLSMAGLERQLQAMFPPYPTAWSLEQLVDMASLRQLAQQDRRLLLTLLQATWQENQRDMQQAGELLARQDWPALSTCLHRLAGSVQIIGAAQAEKRCVSLERLCRGQPDASQLAAALADALGSLNQLNQAIRTFIVAEGESPSDSYQRGVNLACLSDEAPMLASETD